MRDRGRSMPGAARQALVLRVLVGVTASVWLVNGVWCKVLGRVPRHEAIVARIIGAELAPVVTVLIGCAEILLAAWIISGRHRWLCALTQIVVVLTMNVIEQVAAADLLLWGRFNFLWASLFCAVVAVVGLRADPRADPCADPCVGAGAAPGAAPGRGAS
jgi:hypothetical protein